eukprot:6198763-Pleurochrysis_carterae.AAC.1
MPIISIIRACPGPWQPGAPNKTSPRSQPFALAEGGVKGGLSLAVAATRQRAGIDASSSHKRSLGGAPAEACNRSTSI